MRIVLKSIQFAKSITVLVLIFVISGCLPSLSTGYKVLPKFSKAVAVPVYKKIMIARISSSASSLTGMTSSETRGLGYKVSTTTHQFSKTQDTQFPGFIKAIEKSNVASVVIESPISGATVFENIRHAQKRNVKYLVVSHLGSTPTNSGYNTQGIPMIILAISIVGLIFLPLFSPFTYKSSAVLNIEVWSVSEKIRVYRKSFSGVGYSKGWDGSSSKIKYTKSSVSKAINDAYSKAIPNVIRFLSQNRI